MKLNNLLFGILSMLAFSSYSQSQIREQTVKASITAITEYHLKTSNIYELKSFDWTSLNKVFKDNEQDDRIKLIFEYEDRSKKGNSDPKVKNFNFELTGTTEELPDLIEKSKNLIFKFSEIVEK